MKNEKMLRRWPALLRQVLSNKTSRALLVLASLGLASCSPDGCGSEQDPAPKGTCDTYATVETDACWNTYLGHHLLRTDDGRLLLPQGSLVQLPNLQDGERIKIAYVPVAEDSRYSNTCNYIMGPEQTTPIKITCFESVFFCGTPTQSQDRD